MQCSSQSLYIVEFIPPNTLTLLTILTTVTNWFCQKLNVIFHCLYFWFSWVFESTSKSPWQQALLSPSHRSSTPITWCFLDRWAARIMNEHERTVLQKETSVSSGAAGNSCVMCSFVQKGDVQGFVQFSTWLTPQKINIEPENDGLEDCFPLPGVYSQVPC